MHINTISVSEYTPNKNMDVLISLDIFLLVYIKHEKILIHSGVHGDSLEGLKGKAAHQKFI